MVRLWLRLLLYRCIHQTAMQLALLIAFWTDFIADNVCVELPRSSTERYPHAKPLPDVGKSLNCLQLGKRFCLSQC
jgi:hypothetical protein